MKMGKRICIVGAGVSGLAAIKACLEEGLEPFCFEKGSAIGGVWNNTDDTSRPGVNEGLYMNSARINYAFSDFPHKRDAPNFLSFEYLMQYIEEYAEHFGLLQHIQFGTKVKHVTPVESSTNDVVSWSVEYEKDGKGSTTEVFDGVMLAVGVYQQPNIPDIPGLDSFKGTVLHAQHLKKPSDYKNKTILINGLGNSGGDFAVLLAQNKNKVLMCRSYDGSWSIRKSMFFGLPHEACVHNGITHRLLMFRLGVWIWEWLMNFVVIDHDAIGLTPKGHKIGERMIVLSDEFVPYLAHGKIKLRPRPDHFDTEHIVYEDGTKEKIDVVLFCTGYMFHGGVLPDNLYPVTESKKFVCYKFVFLPDPRYRSLGFIGHVTCNSSLLPVYELQTRWYAQIFKGNVQLPSQEKMKSWIEATENAFYTSPVMKGIQIPVVPYTHAVEYIAEEFGARPNPWQFLLTDPSLGLRLLLGVFVPHRYRLVGPHPWSGAREAVLNALPDVFYNTRSKTHDVEPAYVRLLKGMGMLVLFWITIIVVTVAMCFF